MVGDFSLIEEETGPTFQGQPISVTVIENYEPTKLVNKKSILKANEKNISHSAMMESLLQNISGDQLPAARAGLQFYVDLSSDEENQQVSMHRYQYLKLLEQYKQGQLQCNLTNKVTLSELQTLQCTHERKVTFAPATTLRCYSFEETSRPHLLRADNITFSLGTGVTIREAECRKRTSPP